MYVHLTCRLDDLASQEASQRLKEQLLQQEKQLVESQNRWLSTELEAKSTQLFELRKEKANTVAELESKLNFSEEEVSAWWFFLLLGYLSVSE